MLRSVAVVVLWVWVVGGFGQCVCWSERDMRKEHMIYGLLFHRRAVLILKRDYFGRYNLKYHI